MISNRQTAIPSTAPPTTIAVSTVIREREKSMTQGDVPEPVVEDQASENVPILGRRRGPRDAGGRRGSQHRVALPVASDGRFRRMTTRQPGRGSCRGGDAAHRRRYPARPD